MMHPFHIVFGCNDAYAPYLAVCFKSLAMSQPVIKNQVYTLHLLTDKLSGAAIERLKDSIKERTDFLFKMHSINMNLLRGLNAERFTAYTFLRLIIADVLPKEINRVLYLDTDTLVANSVVPLFSLNLKGSTIAAVEQNYDLAKKHIKRLNYNDSLGYFNAGVLLIDLVQWRKNNYTETLLGYCVENKQKLLLFDQDALNLFLKEDKQPLPLCYNITPDGLDSDYYYESPHLSELETAISQPVVVHYAASAPWRQDDRQHPMLFLWDKTNVLLTKPAKKSYYARGLLGLKLKIFYALFPHKKPKETPLSSYKERLEKVKNQQNNTSLIKEKAMNNTPLISIIIPIYNRERYLERCLNSVLAQTYTHWQCVLVDDGSTDNSLTICKDYAQKDNRFLVVHQSNAGVGVARNNGIEHSTGVWLTFVDSDDSIAPLYLEHLLAPTLKQSVDYVMAGMVLHYLSKEPEVYTYKEEVYERSNETFTNNFRGRTAGVGKLLKTSIIKENNLFFHTTLTFGEDRLYSLHYYRLCNTIAVVPYADYNYYIEKPKGDNSSLHKTPKQHEIGIHYLNELHSMAKLFINEQPEGKDVILRELGYDECRNAVISHIQTNPSLSLKQRNAYMKQLPMVFFLATEASAKNIIRGFFLRKKWFSLFSLTFSYIRFKLKNKL